MDYNALSPHAKLYLARQNASPEEQNVLAPMEHQAFAREWTESNPFLAAPSLAVGAPLYTAGKYLGLIKARSEPSLEELAAAYRGIGQGFQNWLSR